MSRRAALAAILTLASLAVPLAAPAQQPSKRPRVGVIAEYSRTDPFIAVFRQGLRELGYIEGRSVVVEYRYLRGVADRAPTFAAELIRRKVDVLVVEGTAATQLTKTVTTAVPIVFVTTSDPVGSGLVATLARPGGNVTGTSTFLPEMSGAYLELLKAAVPQVTRVAVLWNPANPVITPALDEVRETARTLAVELHFLEVRRRKDLAGAFSSLMAWRAGGVLAMPDPVFGNELAHLSMLAAKHRVPAIYPGREFAETGGLLAYGPSFADNYRRAATYVDKILKGAKPADLPVEQPAKFDLVINLRTAWALGLTIPPSLLVRADRVIR